MPGTISRVSGVGGTACLVLAVTVAGAHICSGAEATGQHGPKNIVESYEASLRALRHARFRLRASAFFNGGPFRVEKNVRDVDWHCVRDGARWKIDCNQWDIQRIKGEWGQGRQRCQDLGTEMGEINVWVYPVGANKAEEVDVIARLDGEAPPRSSDEEVLAHRGDLDKFAWLPWPLDMESGGFIFGYVSMDGTARLSKVILESDARIVEPDLNGEATRREVLVESRGKYGRHRVWFDAEAGFLPRRVEVEKSGTEWIDIYDTPVTNATLERLCRSPELEHLSIGGTAIDDAGLANIASLSKLHQLFLGKTRVTDAGLAHLSGIKGLRDLDLFETDVTDAGLAHLAGLTALESLNLNDTNVTDAGIAQLKPLRRLRRLSLVRTKIGDGAMNVIAGFPLVEGLDLYGTGVTDPGAGALARMTRLRRLILRETKVTDQAVARLVDLPALAELGLPESVSDGAMDELRARFPDAKVSH